MGSNNSVLSSNISIQFLDENKNVYQPGEYIQGVIEFNNNNLEYQDKNLLVELIGELVYTTYQKKGKSIIIIITNAMPFFIQKQILHLEKNPWKFSFCLSNNNLPSSFEQNRFQGSFIHYFIRIRCLSNQFIKDFPVIVQRPLQIIESFPMNIVDQNRNDIHLNVNLASNLAFIGQDFSIELHLHNPNHLTIQRISLRLVRLRKLGPSKEERTVLLKQHLKSFHQFKNEFYHENFQINIPSSLTPSCSYSIPFKLIQWFIFVHYEIHVKIHVGGFKKNISLTIPLNINKKTEITSSSSPNYESTISNLNELYL